MASVPRGGLTIGDDGRSATLELNDLAVIDQPKWPALDAKATAAKMNLRVTWKATDKKVLYEDKCRHFRVEGYAATARAAASVEVPALNFSWKSDPIGTSSAAFAVIGTEVNGKYCDQESK